MSAFRKSAFVLAGGVGLFALATAFNPFSSPPQTTRAVATFTTSKLEPAKTSMSMVAFLNKYYSLADHGAAFKAKFRMLAEDLSRQDIADDMDRRLSEATRDVTDPGDGKISRIGPVSFQQNLTVQIVSIIRNAAFTLSQESGFDTQIDLPKNSGVGGIKEIIQNAMAVEPTYRVDESFPAPDLIQKKLLAFEPPVEPVQPIILPSDAQPSDYKGRVRVPFTKANRLAYGEQQRAKREERRAKRYSPQVPDEEINPKRQQNTAKDLPGVFNGLSLDVLVKVAYAMADVSSIPADKIELKKRADAIKSDAIVAVNRLARGRTITRVPTDNEDIRRIIARGGVFAQTLYQMPGYRDALERVAGKGSASGLNRAQLEFHSRHMNYIINSSQPYMEPRLRIKRTQLPPMPGKI